MNRFTNVASVLKIKKKVQKTQRANTHTHTKESIYISQLLTFSKAQLVGCCISDADDDP